MTRHFNDVCRLWGGGVFNQPVFGAEAAPGPEEDRAVAAQRLMQQVFADAALMQWGQLVGATPVSVQREHGHEYITGTFLLAGSEVFRLSRSGVLADREQ